MYIPSASPTSGAGGPDEEPLDPVFPPTDSPISNEHQSHHDPLVYFFDPSVHHHQRAEASYPPPPSSTRHPGADPPNHVAVPPLTAYTIYPMRNHPHIDIPINAHSDNSIAGWVRDAGVGSVHRYVPNWVPSITAVNIGGQQHIAGRDMATLGPWSGAPHPELLYWVPPQNYPPLVSPLSQGPLSPVSPNQFTQQPSDIIEITHYVRPPSPRSAALFDHFPRPDNTREEFLAGSANSEFPELDPSTSFTNHIHILVPEGEHARSMDEPEELEDASITTDAISSGDADTESEDRSMSIVENQPVDPLKQLLADLQQPENENIKTWICQTFTNQPSRQLLAFYISKQAWYQNDEMEPPIEDDDPFVPAGILPSGATTRFEYFHESVEGHLCYADDKNGPCNHTCPRRDRATAHARAHFQYRPFACNGGCRKNGCLERYTSLALLADHVNRKKKPKKQCDICEKVLTRQNLRRHIANIHPDAVQEVAQVSQSRKRRLLAIRNPLQKMSSQTSGGPCA